MIISIVIPAYNASGTIERTLSSVCKPGLPGGWRLDITVVNDGSDDAAGLATIVSSYPGARLIGYDENRGKVCAVNMGIAGSEGDFVIILDADDEFVANWPETFSEIIHEWPDSAPICFAACRTQFGELTVSEPDYSGCLTFEDMLNDRHMGEYLPMFRGRGLRDAGGYRDPKTRLDCAFWTYLSFAEQGSLWITNKVMRVYYVEQDGSLSNALGRPDRAQELVHCYDQIFGSFGAQYKKLAPTTYCKRRLRQAVFSALAKQRRRAFALWWTGATLRAPFETLAALVLIIIGGPLAFGIATRVKKIGIIRRYG